MLLAVLVLGTPVLPLHAAYWDTGNSQTLDQVRDLDGDGIPNLVDPDIDNDGTPNILDRNVDGGIAKTGPYAGTYIGDHIDNDNPSEEDIDDDGLADNALAEYDIDGDGKLDNDPTETDIDGDGLQNGDTSEMDIDSDGLRNDDANEDDEDGDGVEDIDDDDDNNNGIKDIDDSNYHPEGDESEVQADLIAQPAAPTESTAKVTLQHFGTGEIKFTVDARDLATGNYDFVVAGVVRGTLVVQQESNHTRGTLIYKSTGSGGSLLLNFTVAEQIIALRQGATDYCTGIVPTLPGPSEGDDTFNLIRGQAAPSNATAEVTMHFGPTGPTTLELVIAKAPVGDYELVIGEATRGTIHVSATSTSTRGELHFEVGGSGGTLPLNFESAGQPIAIIQAESTFFFGQLPSSAP